MYWIGPGRHTADRTRAFSIYGAVGFAAIGLVVLVSMATTGGVSLGGLVNAAYVAVLISFVVGYSIWRNHVDRQAQMAQYGAGPGGLIRGGSVIPAVFTPAPGQVPTYASHPGQMPMYPQPGHLYGPQPGQMAPMPVYQRPSGQPMPPMPPQMPAYPAQPGQMPVCPAQPGQGPMYAAAPPGYPQPGPMPGYPGVPPEQPQPGMYAPSPMPGQAYVYGAPAPAAPGQIVIDDPTRPG